MATLIEPGSAIEATKLEGQSRKPLAAYGYWIENDVECEKYVARFDVRSTIAEASPAPPEIVPTASVSPADEVVCESAVVFSKDDTPSSRVGPGSGTHQTNFWKFTKTTALVVLTAHQDLLNGLRARQEKARQLAVKKK